MSVNSVTLTGAHGFLGFHVRAALRGQGIEPRALSLGDGYNAVAASKAVDGAQRLIHLAGINRGDDNVVFEGNVRFARQLATSITESNQPPSTVVFANSTQSNNGSVYGDAKSAAAGIVRVAAESVGAEFHDVQLPNLFGEHGRPFYNAVTATFCHMLAQGERPVIQRDTELTLLHAQDAADLLIGLAGNAVAESLQVRESVSGLLRRLEVMAALYARGEIPDVSSPFARNLFNTYRSFTFPGQAPVRLTQHADVRGSFVETVRSHGGCGQSSFSTTASGISRGNHFHRRKIERFTVLAGTATIALRRLFTDDVYEFNVGGDEPVAVDMPTMWAHSVTNTGGDVLYTSFWTNEIFDPQLPDTIAETVRK